MPILHQKNGYFLLEMAPFHQFCVRKCTKLIQSHFKLFSKNHGKIHLILILWDIEEVIVLVWPSRHSLDKTIGITSHSAAGINKLDKKN